MEEAEETADDKTVEVIVGESCVATQASDSRHERSREHLLWLWV